MCPRAAMPAPSRAAGGLFGLKGTLKGRAVPVSAMAFGLDAGRWRFDAISTILNAPASVAAQLSVRNGDVTINAQSFRTC